MLPRSDNQLPLPQAPRTWVSLPRTQLSFISTKLSFLEVFDAAQLAMRQRAASETSATKHRKYFSHEGFTRFDLKTDFTRHVGFSFQAICQDLPRLHAGHWVTPLRTGTKIIPARPPQKTKDCPTGAFCSPPSACVVAEGPFLEVKLGRKAVSRNRSVEI